MLRTQVYLPEELHRELMLLAKSRGVNFSSLIREGAQEVINRKRVRQKKHPWSFCWVQEAEKVLKICLKE